jgi:dihydrodipicolinate synthase/N-acetylneuraminate lyase
MFHPEGVYAAMLTPFDTNGRVNIKTVSKMVDFFVEKGVDGIFPVSNVGEFIQISEEDKRCFVDAVIASAGGRVKVTPGISSPNPRQAIAFGKYCLQASADAVVISAPYYYKYPPELVEGYLSQVAKGLDLPVILYNVPSFANEISIDSLIRMLEIENIVAIKESSGNTANLQNILNCVDGLNRDFRVMVGWEEMLLSALTVGAHGCMVASGGILPELMTAILRHYQMNQIEQAAHIQRLVARATEEMKKVFFPYGYKLGMQARGFDMGPFIIDIPATYAPHLQDQQKKIAETIDEVIQDTQLLFRQNRANT